MDNACINYMCEVFDYAFPSAVPPVCIQPHGNTRSTSTSATPSAASAVSVASATSDVGSTKKFRCWSSCKVCSGCKCCKNHEPCDKDCGCDPEKCQNRGQPKAQVEDGWGKTTFPLREARFDATKCGPRRAPKKKMTEVEAFFMFADKEFFEKI